MIMLGRKNLCDPYKNKTYSYCEKFKESWKVSNLSVYFGKLEQIRNWYLNSPEYENEENEKRKEYGNVVHGP